MRLDPRSLPLPTVVLLGLLAAIVLAVGFGAATSDAAFAPHNAGWDGLTELRGEAEAAGAEPVVVADAERYRTVEADGAVAFVLAPENRSGAERAALASFVRRGGTVVVATRDTAGGDLLTAIGTDIGVEGPTLRDEHNELHGSAFPTVQTTADHRAVRDVAGLSLNHGTALTVGPDARVLANSSSVAYLDRDEDGAIGPGETLAARPVIAAQQVGDGEVLAVSDPSVSINVMLDHEPNRQFAANLATGADRVLIDRVDGGQPPLRTLLSWLRAWPPAAAVVGASVVGLVIAWERRLHSRAARTLRGTWRRRRGTDHSAARWQDGDHDLDRAALSDALADRHPEWESERRERVLGGVMGDGLESSDDARGD